MAHVAVTRRQQSTGSSSPARKARGASHPKRSKARAARGIIPRRSHYDRCGLFLVGGNGWGGRTYGFIDRSGDGAIPICFPRASRFAGGLAAVSDGKLWGYINRSPIDSRGRLNYVVDFQYDYCSDFESGLGAVLKNDRWGFVNTKGEVVVKPKYTGVGPASEGMVPVQVGGKPVSDGKMVVGGKWGFINTKGEVVVKPRFRAVKSFCRGLARVNVGGRYDGCVSITGGKWGTIDKTGRIVVEPTADAPENAKGSPLPARTKEWDSPPGAGLRWRREGRFSEGLARIRTEDGKAGFVDRSGKVVIKPRFDDAGYFSEGRAEVSVGGFLGSGSRPPFGKTAFIDTKGRLITEPMYDRVAPFFDGLAEVYIGCRIELPGYPEGSEHEVAHLNGGVRGYINRSGKLVWGAWE